MASTTTTTASSAALAPATAAAPPPDPSSLLPLPSKSDLCHSYVGLPLSSLPTPSLILDRAVIRRNCARMAKIADNWGVTLRAHVKTHKTAEGTREMMTNGQGSGRVLVSTLAEGWGILRGGLAKEGVVRDILYGLPPSVHKITELAALRTAMQGEAPGAILRLLVDHPEQVEALSQHPSSAQQPWSVMVKIDNGAHRAGLPPSSPALRSLLQQLSTAASRVALYGLYVHAGHSYSSRSPSEADNFLASELKAVLEAYHLARDVISSTTGKLVLSVGATPTAHGASRALQSDELKELRRQIDDEEQELELHAGNYPLLDLQQLATKAQPRPQAEGEGKAGPGPARMNDVAISVLCSVVSSYPGRGAASTSTSTTPSSSSSAAQQGDESLIDGGGLAFSKDVGPWAGYGHVVWPRELRGWQLSRPSQEHGIMTLRGEEERRGQWVFDGEEAATAPRGVKVGEKVRIVPQHACMTCAAHPWFYIVDSDEDGGSGSDDDFSRRVVDVWVPWKGW